MKHRREAKYHLLAINFDKYDFSQLFDEETRNGKKILWKIGGKNGKGAQNYNIDDKCYIYYTNLPDRTNRILLCGVVAESDTDRENMNSEKYSYNKTDKIKGIWLSDIKAIALEEPKRFDSVTLSTQYGKDSIQDQQYLDTPNEKKLIEDLEKCSARENLKSVRDYFDNFTKCFFSGKDHKKHITFTSARGINFYEKHHLILNSYLKNEGLAKLKNNHHILVPLCPACHKQIHHGCAEDVRKMIHLIYEADSEWYNETFKKYAKEENYSDVEKWILHIYNLQREHNHYELL